MTTFAGSSSSYFRKNIFLFTLLVVWLLSYIFGLFLHQFLQPYSASLMRSVLLQPVSIVGLLLIYFFPLLLSYLSTFFNRHFIIYFVCFFFSVSFGFTFCGISEYFQSASWLFRFLLMFSEHCFILILGMLWIYSLKSSTPINSYYYVISGIIGVVIATVDYWIISPLLLRVL